MPFVSGAFRRAGGLAAAFFVDAAAGCADFLRLAGFLAVVFFALLDFDFFLLAVRLAGAFFRITFFPEDFFPVDRRAAFLGAADLFFATFFLDDFLLLTLRFLPVVFLLAGGDLRVAAFFLLAAARFRCLLAAFLAGMFDSCRSEKNAGLYIAGPNMEARKRGFSRLWPECAAQSSPPGKRGLSRISGHRIDRADAHFGSCCHGTATIVLCNDLHYTTAILRANGVKTPDAIKQDQACRL
ncbi:MAG: hypothetical protein ACREQ8_01430 [Woeseiaceae bacterium]